MTEDLKTVTISEELNRAVQAAINPADIRSAILAEARNQTEAAEKEAADKAAADAKVVADQAASDAANVSSSFTRVESIGGKDFTFEAESEIELERMINNAYRVAFAVQEPVPSTTVDYAAQAAKEAADKAAAEQDVVDRTELELQFKRGEISAADFIEKSGAVRDYFAKEGLPIESLREAVDRSREQKETQSWERATEVFLNSPAGSDWPGGPRNLSLIGMKIAELGLVDAEDKVAALASAYQSMKTSKLIFPYESPTASADAAAVATGVNTGENVTTKTAAVAPPVTATITPTRAPAKSSSLFGTSSGAGAQNAGATTSATSTTFDIPKEASPAEILAAWKAQMVANGKDPNEAFKENFSARRV